MIKIIEETVDYLKDKGFDSPEIGIILGTGLGQLINDVEIIKEVEVPVEVPFKYYVDEKGQVYDEDGNVLEGKTLERKLEEIQKRVLKYQK